MPKTYTVKQVADILGYSTNSIYTFLKEKRLKGVRVGKGRFRIPETELARVLHLSKTTVQTVAPLPSPPSQPSVGGYLLPDIFDWFVGLSAIVAGLALFLFNTSTFNPQFSRIILIASGVGIIASSVARGAWGWHRVFHGILALSGLVNAFFLFRAGDVDGAILYAGLALVIATQVVVHLYGITALGLYLSFLALAMPFGIFFASSDSHFATLVKFFGVTPVIFGMGISGISVLFLFSFWTGIWKNLWLLRLAAFLAAGLLIAASVYYAMLQYWSRAFFLTVVGFFSLVSPLWHSIQSTHTRRERVLFHLVFGGVGIVLLGSVVLVSVIQRMVWEQNREEFFNKITAASTTIVTTIDSVKSTMVVASTNPDVVDAFVKKDVTDMARFGKIFYESNPNIRRIVFLDKLGNGMALYPYGTFDQPNFSFREYFQKARDTGKPYVSNVYQALSDNAGRFVVVVAVPVLSQKGDFAGVMAGSIDLDRLGLRLTQLAVESRGEYFVVADNVNKIIFDSRSERIGTDVPPDDVLRDAVSGKKDVVQGSLMDGTIGMIAYAPVPQLGWGVSLRVPAEKVFTLTSTATLMIFGLIATLLLSAVVFLVLIRFHYAPQGGGP